MERNSRIKRDNLPAQNTRLPLIGKIRCGMKQVNQQGKEYPVSLDYFIATGAYASKFDEVYQKPSKIQIVFISDDDFQSCFEEWDGRDKEGRKAGYGDGQTYWLWEYGKGVYEPTEDKQAVAAFSKQHTVKWRQLLTINFVIPAIKGVFGVWQLQTGGDKSSINAIRNTFDEIKETAGTVVNIPFDLVVKKVTSNKPEAKSVYPVISLVPNISSENMEVLRKFFEAGLDIKKQGMLNEQKLTALQQHATVEIQASAEDSPVNENRADRSTILTGDINKLPDNLRMIPNEEMDVKDLPTMASITMKTKGTALDAASNSVMSKFEKSVDAAASGVTHEQDVAAQIKRCKTVQQLQELFAVEPSLFMEDEGTPLNVQFTDRLNELTAQANG
jgi:hypothetical protein